jgi:alpha-beta hydrolase superfamily lysophospholipase
VIADRSDVTAEPVHFYSDGVRLVGDVYAPPGDGQPRPAVVTCHGFGGIKQFYLADIAAELSRHGFVTLAFDYRGFGGSEGERHRLRPLEQVADVLAAITYLGTRAEVDAGRIGVYGTSFGGGIAVTAAAQEPQVRAAVCAVGIADCGRWLRSLRRYWEWLDFEKELEADRRNRVLTGRSRRVDPNEVMVKDPESLQHDVFVQENWPERKFDLDLASADAIIAFRPVEWIERISPRPVLIIGVDEDALTPYEHTEMLYAAAGEPKQLIQLGGVAHHDIYKPHQQRDLLARVAGFLGSSL